MTFFPRLMTRKEYAKEKSYEEFKLLIERAFIKDYRIVEIVRLKEELLEVNDVLDSDPAV